MYTFDVQIEENKCKLVLTGVINEDVDFSLFKVPENLPIDIMCKEITRINSVGVKKWRTFFGGLRQKGVKLQFIDCPWILIEQCTYVDGVIEQAEISSFLLPYFCGQCNSEQVVLKQKMSSKNGIEALCPTCKVQMELEILPEEIPTFLLEDTN